MDYFAHTRKNANIGLRTLSEVPVHELLEQQGHIHQEALYVDLMATLIENRSGLCSKQWIRLSGVRPECQSLKDADRNSFPASRTLHSVVRFYLLKVVAMRKIDGGGALEGRFHVSRHDKWSLP